MIVVDDPTDNETIRDLQKVFNVGIEPAIFPSGETEFVLKEIFDMWFSCR
jgi:hypothetical protein